MTTLQEVGEKKIVSVAASRGGRYGWCATTKMRWGRFCKFCTSINVVSVSQISHDTLKNYSDACCKKLAVTTAQNYISSVNSVLKLLNPSWVSCSPKNLVGRSRSFVRSAFLSFEMENINSAVLDLECVGRIDLALLVQLSSIFGLRRREAALFDIPNALQEARKSGAIDVQRGTKGGRGRSVERWVPCDDVGVDLLERTKRHIGGNRCMVPEGESLKNFYDRISTVCLPVLKRHGIEKFHELRVFYACRRYMEITGFVAPCNRVSVNLIVSHEADEAARKIISVELGHSRVQIVGSYIGRKVRQSRNGE